MNLKLSLLSIGLALLAAVMIACGGADPPIVDGVHGQTPSDPTTTQTQAIALATVYTYQAHNTNCIAGQPAMTTVTLPVTTGQGPCFLTRVKGNLSYNNAPVSNHAIEMSVDPMTGVRTVNIQAVRCNDLVEVDYSCWPWKNFDQGTPRIQPRVAAGTESIGQDEVGTGNVLGQPGLIDGIHGDMAGLGDYATKTGDVMGIYRAGAFYHVFTNNVDTGLGVQTTFMSWPAVVPSGLDPPCRGSCDFCTVSSNVPTCQINSPPGNLHTPLKVMCGFVGISGQWLGSSAQLAINQSDPNSAPTLTSSASPGQASPGGAMSCIDY